MFKPAPAIVVCLGLISSLGLMAATEDRSAQCFTADRVPDFDIQQQAPPPLSDHEDRYSFYPATSVASMNIDRLNASTAHLPQYYWQWSNHGPRRVEKGNLGPGVPPGGAVQIDFSDSQKADACTLVQTAMLLGRDEFARSLAQHSGLTLIGDPSSGAYTDSCPVAKVVLKPSITGIVLDYEVQDGRTPAQTLSFLTRYADFVHSANKQVILYTNPLDAPSQPKTGINASNAPALMRAFDQMSVVLWGGNKQHDFTASFNAQWAILGQPDPDKTLIVFDLNKSTLQDAKTVRQLAKDHKIRHLNLWRDYASQGGACDTPVNQKIACLAFGKCP